MSPGLGILSCKEELPKIMMQGVKIEILMLHGKSYKFFDAGLTFD